MATDARISTGLPGHPKAKKLMRRLGQAAGWNLVCLILWTAANRSDGDLSGMSNEDIELAAEWEGEEGRFVETLASVRFLDGVEGDYALHDWHEHNPWAAGSEARSAKARWNAAKRHHGVAEADRLVPEYAAIRNAGSSATSNAAEDATSKLPAQEQHTGSNAPSPSPSPSPTVIQEAKASLSASSQPPDAEEPDDGVPPCPFESLIDSYEAALPAMPTVRRSLFVNGANGKAMRARWRWVMTAKHERGERTGERLASTAEEGKAWFMRYFAYVADSDFLSGRNGKFPACDLSWLVNAGNFEKVLSGKYHGEQRETAHA